MMRNSSKKLGFALGSGGARGVAHIGFLKAMVEAGIKPYYVAGVSMGSVVGACYCSGMDMDYCKEVVTNLKPFEIIDLSASPLLSMGLVKCQKIRKKFAKYIGEITFAELKTPFVCSAVNLHTAELIDFKEGVVADAILASSSIPAVFKPTEIGDGLYIDGGVFCRVPVRQVKEMGADVVIAVDVLGPIQSSPKITNFIELFVRLYDLVDANNTECAKEKYRDMFDMWLEPDMPNVSAYKIKNLNEAYDAGYKIGVDNVEKIKKLLED